MPTSDPDFSSLLLVLLAHNEAACIGASVGEARQALPGVNVAVVDDGSQDATAEEARRAGAVVLRHPFNLGVAAGESTGLLYAARMGFARAVRMDGDGQHDPTCIPELLSHLDAGADLVVGSRFAGVETFRSSFMRRLGNQGLARLVSALAGQTITDPTSGFRAFSARAIQLFSEHHPHDFPEPESILMARQAGLRVVETPVRMRPRRTGRSSLTPLRAGYYMAKVSFALLMERLRA